MLILPIKKKWFDMILSGEKKEEYREIKEYWRKRIANVIGKNTSWVDMILYSGDRIIIQVLFKNGYSAEAPTMQGKCRLRVDCGKPEWGAEPGKPYYVFEIIEEGKDNVNS